ncbi:MAG: AAA family ATPase [Cytophagales bacterium]|nr:AAA family ATPase [Cytophagales bacterium]
MLNLQKSFLNKYEPLIGPITRKRSIIANLLGSSPPELPPTYSTNPPISIKNDELNDDQFQVLQQVISQRQFLVSCNGGPGSGKSKLVTEILYYLLSEDPEMKILVCCSANRAVDNLALSTLKLFTRRKLDRTLLRVYAREREPLADPSLSQISLHHIANHDHSSNRPELESFQQESSDLLREINKLSFLDKTLHPPDRHHAFEDASAKVKRLKLLRQDIETTLLHNMINPNIIFTTLASANDDRLRDFQYDFLIIDEVAAASALDIHMACDKLFDHCRGILLSGDCHQLPPTDHATGDMGRLATRSLFDIWDSTHVVKPVQLTISYRCNSELLEFLQMEVYQNALESGLLVNISAHVLSHYPFPQPDWPTVLINCAGSERTDLTGSKFNFEEADRSVSLAKQLVMSGAATPADITILTFYHGQSVVIRQNLLLEPGLEDLPVSSVDGIQGREHNIVILSAVRAAQHASDVNTLVQPTGSTLGFITDKRRLTVALSRCRMALFIIGDLHHLATSNSLWSRLVDYYSSNGMTA